jgi:hypothetical protein
MVAVVALGCASMTPPLPLAAPEQLTRSVAAPPASVVRGAIATFAELGVPVQTQDAAAGLVTGAETTMRMMWGAVPVKDRMFCGKAWDSGNEYAVTAPVKFTLGILASPSAVGSDVRITFNGSAMAPGVMGGPAYQECELTAAFAGELLGRIAVASTRGL